MNQHVPHPASGETALRAIIALQSEEILLLKSQLGMERENRFLMALRDQFGITSGQSRLLAALARAGSASRDALFRAYCTAHTEADEPDIKIIDAQVHHLRRRLANSLVRIETVWGQGYRLTPEGRRVVLALGVTAP